MTENRPTGRLENITPEREDASAIRERLESSLSTFGVSVDLELARPVTLVRAIGRVGDTPSEPVHREVVTAVGFLEGYRRLREDLLTSAHDTSRERDRSLLASDYLQAGAYSAFDDSTLPAATKLACYRHLTVGSTALAEQLFEPGSGPDERLSPRAVLVGTAGALGAVVADLEDAAGATRTYGESVTMATELAVDHPDVDVRETLAATLNGGRERIGVTDDRLEAYLESAREALEAIPDGPGRTRLEAGTWALEE
ncbi:hypothetical protein ACYJ1Y_00035 [Natrialbaceae archaeon A-gly3]